MSAQIDKIQEELIEEFNLFEDWMDKYEYLIELGKTLPAMEEKYKKEENLIRGCQSQVWLHSTLQEGSVSYTADSDAIITKGLIALVIRTLNHQSPENILGAELFLIEKIGLHDHLSPSRSNGLHSMIDQLKRDAKAFQLGNRSALS